MQSQLTAQKVIHKRAANGQSLLEYALGIGCVCAICMIALAAVGHLSGHMVAEVNNAVNAPDHKTSHPEEICNLQATPWVLQ